MKRLAGLFLASLLFTPASATAPKRTVQELTIQSGDGTPLKAVLSRPQGGGRYPTIITVHGGEGGRDFATVRAVADPSSDSPTVQMLNDSDWAILSIGFRPGAILGAEEDDVVAAVRFAQANPALDPKRIALVGGSHGGNLVLRAAIRTGKAANCAVAGSPWMTNPELFLKGEFSKAPLSELKPAAQRFISTSRERLLAGFSRRGLVNADLDRAIADKSIERNAKHIEIPALFLLSEADVQVPASLVEPTIAAMQAAGRKAEVLKVRDSLHGFYWGRTGEFGARAGAGPKTPTQWAEEETTRRVMRDFLQRCLSR